MKGIPSKKYTLLMGTLLLTMTGLLTRVLGFFYRIFLSRTIGAEGLGVYNMVHPIFGICFALCAGSIQTAISQLVASNVQKGRSIFKVGLTISLSISIVLSFLIWHYADFLSSYVLMEPRCSPFLVYLAISVPCSAIHACINGYYYGMQKTKVPAFAQVVEQVIRIGAVFLIADIMTENGMQITVELAILGHLIGEIASSLYTIICIQFFPPKTAKKLKKNRFFEDWNEASIPLMALALPLMGNRLVLNILASAESIFIPTRLTLFGLSSSEAFSIYGVLTGMALPFILFPSTIFNSLAVILLPTVAKAQSDGNKQHISTTISVTLRYSLYMGILCIGVFSLFGHSLGVSVFKDANSGDFIQVLAWLCPFLYLATTMGSILNGLGKTSTTFLQNVAAMVLRLFFVWFGIPRFGIIAYLWGVLASELLLALLHLYSLKRLIPFSWNAMEMIAKPTFFMILSIGIYRMFFSVDVKSSSGFALFFETSFHIGVLCALYGGFLLLFHFGKRETYKD